PRMEPRQQRENPPGSGEPESGEWREESAAVETGARDDTLKNRSGDGGNEETTSKTENTVVAEKDKAEFDEDEEQYEEELDPRIQEELEHLNQASDEINRLELQLDEARSSYRRILTDSARKLNAQGSQLGACIEKARPYYEARRLAKEVCVCVCKVISLNQEINVLRIDKTVDPERSVNEAEEERLRSEREHQHVTQLCQEAEARVQTLQKALKRVIIKSKPYFELKAQFNHILEEHKSKVVQLEERVAKVKTRYSVALRNLEQISEQIHAQRGRIRAARERNRARGGRSSPVGAESEGVIQSGAYAGVVANPLMDNDWADQEKTRQWVEKHRDTGWGRRERAEKAGSDSMSVISLQTIASDLEKFDSVEHLGDLSDVGSIIGEEKEAESERGFRVDDRIVEREVANLSRQDAEKGASGADRQQRDRERESFVKQHHRSISL
uniref:SH3 domain-binding protein 5 n=1 Tax=Sinocyclocheilus grahami TaxID=75366 RepID=A0A672LNA2_SINGR